MSISTLFLCVATAISGTHAVLPAGMHLVEGEVLDIEASNASYVSKVKINRVYGTGEGLVGREFSARSADPKFKGNAARLVIPRLRVGERGIWVVRDWYGELHHLDSYNYARWPTREGGGRRGEPPIGAAKRFAEAIARVSKLPTADEAAAALQALTTDANPYISSWAIARLPAVCRDAARASHFLEGLVRDEHVPIQGQVAIDRALLGQEDGSILVEHHNRQWQNSQSRLNLFRRWFAGAPPSTRDAALVVSRLDLITQHPDMQGFSQENLLQLVTLLAKNEQFPLSERQRARTIMSWPAERYDDGDEKVFEKAVELVSSDLPEQMRARIAGVFASRVALDEKRRTVLRKLRDAEKSESVEAILKEALARPIGKKP